MQSHFSSRAITQLVLLVSLIGIGLINSAQAQSPDYRAFVRDLSFSVDIPPGSSVQFIDKKFELRGNGPIVDWHVDFYSAVVDGPDHGTACDAVANWPKPNESPVAIIAGLCSPQPTSIYAISGGQRVEWVPEGSGNYRAAGELDLSKLDLKPGALFSTQVLEEYSLEIPGGVNAQGLGGLFSWTKPGVTFVRSPLPAAGETLTGPIAGTCKLPNGDDQNVTNNNPRVDSLGGILLRDPTVIDNRSAEIPSGCGSCGSEGPSSQANRLMLLREHNPNNMFWHSSMGRGFYSHFDYSLKFRNDEGSLALLSDPLLGVVVKFRERLEGQQTGGGGHPPGAGGQPPGGQGPTGLVPTGIYDPVDQDNYKSFTVVDESGAAVLNPTVEAETKKVFATLTRRNGWEYKFRLIDRFNSRLIEVKDPEGKTSSISYQSDIPMFTEDELRESPTRLMRIDKIVGPNGELAIFEYHDSKVAGRWAIKKVDLDGDEIEYVYNGQGMLSEVKRKRASGTDFLTYSSYQYVSTGSSAEIEKVQFDGQKFVKQTLMLAPEYATAALNAEDNLVGMPWLAPDEFGGLGDPNFDNELKLVNQAGNVLVGRKNGSGQVSLQVYFEQSPVQIDDNKIRLVYEGQLIEWSVGQSIRYAKSLPADPSDFSQGDFENANDPGEMYSRNINVTAEQILYNIPSEHRNAAGYTTNLEYDLNHNLKKVYHPDSPSTYEEFDYNEFNQPIYYRDRAGVVTKTIRDSAGRIVQVIRGLTENGNGTETPHPEAIQTRYVYGTNGLLEWTATVKYPYFGFPPEDHRTTYHYNGELRLVRVQYPAVQTAIGVLTRPESNYVWNNDQLVSMTDPEGQVTTFLYDDYGRVIRNTYLADGTTSETWYDDSNRRIYRKSRGDIVSRTIFDTSCRLSRTDAALAKDSTILDAGVSNVSPEKDRDVTIRYYHSGWTTPYYTRVNGNATRNYFDHRGRKRHVYRYSMRGGYFRKIYNYFDNRVIKEVTTNYQRVNESPVFTSAYKYNGYSATGEMVRSVTCAKSTSFPDNQTLLNLNRPTNDSPSILIEDAVRDLSGNPVEVTGAGSEKTRTEFNTLGNRIRMHRAFGTVEQLTTELEYDDFGRPSAIIEPDGIRNETFYDPSGNVVETRVVASDGSGVQSTRYTYTLKGNTKQTIANDGSQTEVFFNNCCGRQVGLRDPLGNGTITNVNSLGQVVHKAVVGNFDVQVSKNLNPDTAHTYSESTSRFRHDGNLSFQTKWSVDPGQIALNNPPIAGLDGVPVANGLTTQYVYDKYLFDGIGLDDAGSGQSISPLHSGAASSINIVAALDKLKSVESSGGAETWFLNGQDGSATVAISPDEKTMQVSIEDGIGRNVMTAVMSGPAAASPNDLLDWTCTRHSMPYGLPGYGYSHETRTIDRDGLTIRMFKNGFGHTVGHMDQDGNLTRRVFNSYGALVKLIDPLGRETEFGYNLLGEQDFEKDAKNGTRLTSYDSGGRVKTVTDRKGNVSTNNYDGFGRLASYVDREGNTTVNFYDNMNRVSAVSDTENKGTSLEYDDLGQLIKRTLDDGSETSYVYDPVGREIEVLMPSGKRRVTNYLFSGKVESVDYFSAGNVLAGTDSFTYDDNLRRSASIGRYGVEREYSYTERGKLLTEITKAGGINYPVTHSYDDRGRILAVNYPSGKDAEYEYDDRQRLRIVKWENQIIETRSYNENGLIASILRPSVNETRTYDELNRVTSIANNDGGVNDVGTVTYAYDANSNKVSETWAGVMSSWSYSTNAGGSDGYDGENRLTGFTQTGQNVSLQLTRSNVGNITNYRKNNVDSIRSYSDVHALTAQGADVQSHDLDGNVIHTLQGLDIDWDESGMLKQVIVTSDDSAGVEGINGYGYDADGRRVSKTITRNGAIVETKIYLYAGLNCIAEYDLGSSPNSPVNEFVYAHDVDSVVLIDHLNGTSKLSVCSNQQKSITALVDLNSVVQERYGYQPFGEITTMNASGVEIHSSQFGNPYGFTGRRHDFESGLVFFRKRYYDTSTAGFLSIDPWGYVNGHSMYRSYMELGKTDPLGTCVQDDECCIGKALGADSYFERTMAVKFNMGGGVFVFEIDELDFGEEKPFEDLMEKLKKFVKKAGGWKQFLNAARRGRARVENAEALSVEVGFEFDVDFRFGGCKDWVWTPSSFSVFKNFSSADLSKVSLHPDDKEKILKLIESVILGNDGGVTIAKRAKANIDDFDPIDAIIEELKLTRYDTTWDRVYIEKKRPSYSECLKNLQKGSEFRKRKDELDRKRQNPMQSAPDA